MINTRIGPLVGARDPFEVRFGVLRLKPPAAWPKGWPPVVGTRWELVAETTRIPRLEDKTGFRFGVVVRHRQAADAGLWVPFTLAVEEWRPQLPGRVPRWVRVIHPDRRIVGARPLPYITEQAVPLWLARDDPLGPRRLTVFVNNRAARVFYYVVEDEAAC